MICCVVPGTRRCVIPTLSRPHNFSMLFSEQPPRPSGLRLGGSENSDKNLPSMVFMHGRRKDFFQRVTWRFFKNFSSGGQKWWNFFPTQN